MSDHPPVRRGLNSLFTGKGCLLVFVVLVVLCSGLGVGGYKLMGWMERSTEASERAENPKDPRWAEVGSCVVEAPASAEPDKMALSECATKGSYKVVERYDGTNMMAKCSQGTDTYSYSAGRRKRSQSFVLCLQKN
jgi:hypothetical protein